MKTKLTDFSFLLIVTILVISCDSFRSSTDKFDINSNKVTAIIQSSMDSIQISQYFPDKDVRKYLHQEFMDFYKLRDYKLAWVSFEEPENQVEELLEAIDEADREGLEPDSYKVAEIEKLLDEVFKIESRKDKRTRLRAKKSNNEEIANEARQQDTLKLYNLTRLDFLLTSTYLTYASHLLSGKIHPSEKELWFPERRKKELASYLNEALTKNKVKSSLLDLSPTHSAYHNLKNALAAYQELLLEEELPKIPLIEDLKLGSSDTSILILKKKLASTGDFNAEKIYENDSIVFNQELKDALLKFQIRNGLEENGLPDQATLDEINIPIPDRIDQIKLNMERMRWLPETFGDKYLLVNIPEYKLRVYNGQNVDLEMKIIVGKTYNATPIFSDEMDHIVFSPTWTVPRSISIEEILPGLRNDPEYLEKRNFVLYESWEEDAEPIDPETIKWDKIDEEDFHYKVVQRPGNENALGSVKFMFPNNFDIYLHDTPAGHLFSRRERNFSHGCIRVEQPVELAKYLLKDKKDWDDKRIVEAMGQDEPEVMRLTEKLPVHLVYWTAWVDDNGILNFRNDIYEYDKGQIKQIKES